MPILPAPEQSVEQLIETLEQLKAQKADIEKQEQIVKDMLAKKLGAQNERLKKLGVEKNEGIPPIEPPLPLKVPGKPGRETSTDVKKQPALAASLPKGVRELQSSISLGNRKKIGSSISVCRNEEQVVTEVGEGEGTVRESKAEGDQPTASGRPTKIDSFQ